MEKKEKHICKIEDYKLIYWENSSGYYGSAFDICEELENGKLLIHNGEYSNFVNYCPLCGYKAKNTPTIEEVLMSRIQMWDKLHARVDNNKIIVIGKEMELKKFYCMLDYFKLDIKFYFNYKDELIIELNKTKK